MEKQQSNRKYIGSFLFLVVLMVVTYCFIFRNCNLIMLEQVIFESEIHYLGK